MVKRCISLFLAMIVCFTFAPAVVVSSATNDKTDKTLENLTYKIPVTDEYMEKVFGAPEEILNGSTEELLDYFLNSMFLASRTIPLASSDYVAERQKNADYTAHAAFRELLTRSDLVKVLANNVRNVYFEVTTDEYMIKLLHNLVDHIPDEVIASATETDEERTTASNTEYICYSCGLLGTIWKDVTEIPENILEGSTEDLLNYYRETYDGSVCNHLTLSSVIENDHKFNIFGRNEAFGELITRSDLGNALLKNLADINNGCYVDASITIDEVASADKQIQAEKNKLIQLVAQIPDTTIISIFANTDIELVESCSTTETRVSVLYGSLNGVNYYTSNTIVTPNGNSVLTLVPSSEISASVYNSFLMMAIELEVDIRDYPTAVYNCHSFAWYDRSYDNVRWIPDISGFLNDASCTQIAIDYIQEGDIVVYYDEYEGVLHSGIVTEITGNTEDLVITSKWGQGVACVHSVQNVPEEYLAVSSKDRDNDGVIEENEVSYYVNAEFFRYSAASTSLISSEPYTELDEVAEIVIALPSSKSSVIIGDEDSAD